MSLYRRVQTPNSPLLPLSPIIQAESSLYLSPYATSMRSRRSFTPSQLNFLPPPSLSPIKAGILSGKGKTMRDSCTSMTPDQHELDCSLILSSNKQSMKKVRSTARIQRKITARTTRSAVPLTPIRRSLFPAPKTPQPLIDTPKMPRFVTPRLNFRSSASPKRYSTPESRQYLAETITASPSGYQNDISTMSLLEQTFTVMSILKEINLEKYAILFAREEVDLLVFLLLTYNDLVELGVEEEDRDILLNAVHCYTEVFGTPENISF